MITEDTIVISKTKAQWLSGFLDGLSVDRSNVEWSEFEVALDKVKDKFEELIRGTDEQTKQKETR